MVSSSLNLSPKNKIKEDEIPSFSAKLEGEEEDAGENRMRGGEVEDQQSKALYELCALLLSILRSPSLHLPSPLPRHAPRRVDVSPAGFASLLLGISLSLMLCGSLTFVVGFILMPWVFGFVMVFYLVGLVSNMSVVRRAIAVGCPAMAGHGRSTEAKDMPVEDS